MSRLGAVGAATMTPAREKVLVDLLARDMIEDTARNVARALRRFDPEELVAALTARTLDDNGTGPTVRCVADIEPSGVCWLWKDRIPLGMLSEVCGDPGEGKSHLTLALATAVSLGTPLPGDSPGTSYTAGQVLLVCPEDSPEATVRPRLEAMGADLHRVHLLDGMPGEGPEPVPLDLSRPDHRTHLRDLIGAHEADLVVIDPITAHLGSANEWKDSDVRSVLAPLARTAHETGAAILFVRHLRKGDAAKAIYRAGGSIAFTASVRSSLLVGRPDGDSTRRAVVRAKGNLCAEPRAVGFMLDAGRWTWCEAGDWTAADLLAGDTSREERSRREEAREFLLAALADGARSAKEIRRAAEADGLAWRTVQRAREDLGVRATRVGFASGATWRLPFLADSRLRSEAPMRGPEAGANGHAQVPEAVSPNRPPHSRHDTLIGATGANAVVHGVPAGCEVDRKCGCGQAIGATATQCARCRYPARPTNDEPAPEWAGEALGL